SAARVGRAKRGGVKLRIPQSRLRDSVHGRSRDDAAKGTRLAVTLVIGHDQKHVRRALGRHVARWPVRLRILRIFLDHATEIHWWRGEFLPVNRDGGVW